MFNQSKKLNHLEYICDVSEISENSPSLFNLDNREQIVIFKIDDVCYAVENRCPHAGAFLHEGKVDKAVLTCPWHGWQFNLRTGQCLNVAEAQLKTYKILIKNKKIYVKRTSE